MKIELKDLPTHKELIGKTINVTRQGGKYHYEYQDIPMIRIFKGAKIKIENGIKWIYWYWEPENNPNKYDCGYSGVTLKNNFGKSYLEIIL